MAARLDTVAKFVCERSGWTLSNLALQKMLYLAQVEYGGEHGLRLVDTAFEAWNFGPVSPNLYHKVKMFGASPVQDVFFDARRFQEKDPRRDKLIEVCRKYLGKTPGKLIELTHWAHGAWAKKYEPNTRGIRITEDDIADEYAARITHSAEWRTLSG